MPVIANLYWRESYDRASGRRPPILPSRDLEWGDRYAGVYIPQHPFAEIAIFDIIFEAFAAFESAQIWCL